MSNEAAAKSITTPEAIPPTNSIAIFYLIISYITIFFFHYIQLVLWINCIATETNENT